MCGSSHPYGQDGVGGKPPAPRACLDAVCEPLLPISGEWDAQALGESTQSIDQQRFCPIIALGERGEDDEGGSHGVYRWLFFPPFIFRKERGMQCDARSKPTFSHSSSVAGNPLPSIPVAGHQLSLLISCIISK